MPATLEHLRSIMRRLRDPEGGCPWDLRQDFASISLYTLEEAYEVADAIEREDWEELRDELGDLLLQVVYHAQMAEERGLFTCEEVVEAICDKMIVRHPHVFGDGPAQDEAEIWKNWEERKRTERASRGREGTLAGVAQALPALSRAGKLQKRAADVGFDWPDPAPVLDKIAEELAELTEAANERSRLHELGDLLFATVNYARHVGVDPEDALRRCCARFESRFGHMEGTLAAQGRVPSQCTADDWEELWQQAKRAEAGD